MISYQKLFDLLEKNGYTSYRIKKENLIGQGTLTRMKSGKGGIDAKTIDALCRKFGVQPGDLMEYVDGPGPEEDDFYELFMDSTKINL